MVENNNLERNEYFFNSGVLDVLDDEFYFNFEDSVILDDLIGSEPTLDYEEFPPREVYRNGCSQETSRSMSPLKEFLVFHGETHQLNIDSLGEDSFTTDNSVQSLSTQEANHKPDQNNIKSLDLLNRHGQKLEAVFMDLPQEVYSTSSILEDVPNFNQKFSELSIINNEFEDEDKSLKVSQGSHKLRKPRSRKQQFKCLEHDDLIFYDPFVNMVLEDAEPKKEKPFKMSRPVGLRRSPRIKLLKEKDSRSDRKIK